MKIGFLYTAQKKDGGVYTYASSFLSALKTFKKHEITVFSQDSSKSENILHNRLVSKLRKYIYNFNLINIAGLFNYFQNRSLIRLINSSDLDLMIIPSPNNICLHIKVPLLVSIHDLQHRLNPQFPEVSANGEWESRENSYRNICKKATGILVDSQVGKQDVIKFYGVSPHKICILPYIPQLSIKPDITYSETSKVLNKYKINEKYIFYPANFWPHKNHLRLIKALEIINKHRKNTISLIFSGSTDVSYSTYPEIIAYIKSKKITNHIQYLGFVNNYELSALYKGALALIMPTFFGPTNIPVLEAWKMKCPVIYSNVHGCSEQLGNAGLLIHPARVASIVQALNKLINNPVLRKSLVKKGQIRVRAWNEIDFSLKIADIISQFVKINYVKENF